MSNRRKAQARFRFETRAQLVAHCEIARRYRQHAQSVVFFPRLRIIELHHIFSDRYGGALPDDDAGRADMRLMADHLAQIDPRLIPIWAHGWAPWLIGAELDKLMTDVGTGRRWKADDLARELNLDDETRTRLKIRTIGATDFGKAKRVTRRRRTRNAADRARRARAGAKPHTQSTERLRPWEAAGISRRTFYRRSAKNGTDGTVSRPVPRRGYIGRGRCLEAQVGPSRAGPAHALDDRNNHDAKPLPSVGVRQSLHQSRTDLVAGLAPAAFQAALIERFRLIRAASSLDDAQMARLIELDEIIEAERSRRAMIRGVGFINRSPEATGMTKAQP